MSAVKRRLEELTNPVLDSVRLTGSAVLVARSEDDRYGLDPYRLLTRTLEFCDSWLMGPSAEQTERIAEAEASVAEWAGPPPYDVTAELLEALEDAASDCLDALSEWMEPYGLVVEWDTAGLVVRRSTD